MRDRRIKDRRGCSDARRGRDRRKDHRGREIVDAMVLSLKTNHTWARMTYMALTGMGVDLSPLLKKRKKR